MLSHMKRMAVVLRRSLKQVIPFVLLAPYYHLCCRKPVQKNLVVLADGHQNQLPYSMQAVRERLKTLPHVTVVEYFRDYSFCNPLKGLQIMWRFMPLYARAEYVFICDCFVPTTCCRKRPETTLIQLWHSCGLMKKVGVDSPEDAIGMMKTQYRNTDVFTASSALVSDVLSSALMIPRENFSCAGVSRMDLMYRREWLQGLRAEFDRRHPEYRGKKILLWAPTFRGNVHSGYLIGKEEIRRLQEELRDEYVILVKTHRFANSRDMDSPVSFTAEQILTFADALITDYSSIYFDFLPFRRPIILFAPDLEAYEQNRGIYPNFREMPGYIAQNEAQLRDAIVNMDAWADADYHARLDRLWNEQMEYCDGHSTDKLFCQIGLLPPAEETP